MGRFSVGILQVLIAAGCGLASNSVAAQAIEDEARPCEALEAAPVEDQDTQLYVVCGSNAVTLGHVDSYEITQIPQLASAAIVTRLEGLVRAFLVMDNGSDGLALEEITGIITDAAGHGAQSDIVGIEANFGTSTIDVGSAAMNMTRGDAASAVVVDLVALAERSRAVRGNSQDKGAE
ncbi:hypothetical protein IDJ81_13710 [Tsuneonella flava]|uniref:Uncharacterized protein n=1 Tax=Tsuneonella flava TaxID=2055955 RepID=A0ABX7K8V9_9SPHN|nr:hypothetical protein [Tsuneonella flava]QSB44353.1 hypothetical protein IDJ81_13710 [Tsuneonella flava]